MDRKSLIIAGTFTALLLIATVFYLVNTDIAVLNPAGPIAFFERRVILLTIALSGLVVIPVFGLLFYVAWKYRAGSPTAEAHHRPDWDHDSRAAEISWWLVPSVIIVVLSGIAWGSSHALDPHKPLPGEKPLEIQVVALTWKWLFVYPDERVASINTLTVPVGRPVHFTLTADAPMNSFWVPQLGGQIMVMPGMSTQLYLRADREGEYRGYSANISGEGFSGMGFIVHAVPPDEYDMWTETVRSSSAPLDRHSLPKLLVPSTYNQPATYSLLYPNLYNDIIMHSLTP